MEIAHFAAVNTIETINKQYRVSADDKIIAVSSYDLTYQYMTFLES